MSTTFTMFKAIALASFLGQAAAHIVMANPQPFSAEYMATSPLASDGSNFPCQYTGPSSYNFNHMNEMAVGQDQLLSFNGSASHGGGTCQLAVTLDTAPTKSSVWKNIMVLEGGCPVVGNGNDGTKTFKFQIPAGFPNGKATFSWVWNNRIGNREIYMSCAPITVSGGADDGKAFYNSLPDLYVVNMPPEDCTVAENGNLIIPNPGQNVIRDTSAPGAFISATGPKCAAAKSYSGNDGSSGGGGSGSGSSSAAAPASSAATSTGLITMITQAPGATAAPTTGYGAAPTAVTTTSPQPITIIPINTSTLNPNNKGAGSPPTTLVTQPTSAATYAPPAAPTTSAGGNSSPGGTAYAPPSSGGSSAGASSGGQCSSANDGALVCNGSSLFGLCNHGSVVWQSVAAGTQCVSGAIVKKRDEDAVEEEEVAAVVERAVGHPHWGGRRF
jgi:hypothetical protein